jgi:hypothetical protein
MRLSLARLKKYTFAGYSLPFSGEVARKVPLARTMDQDSIMLAGAWPDMQCCKLMFRHSKRETDAESMLVLPTVQWSNGS